MPTSARWRDGNFDNAYPGQYALLRSLEITSFLLDQFGRPQWGAVLEHRADVGSANALSDGAEEAA